MITLAQFITMYDTPGSVVLLEGKRNVVEVDKPKLVALGRLLASNTQHMLFRSGNADGADALFSQGITAITNIRLQVVTPYSGHRKKDNYAYETLPLDKVEISPDSPLVYYSRKNKKMKNLVDLYLSGVKNNNTAKAAYIIRDTMKVTGTDTVSRATFGIFYDDLQHPCQGGTGHTMQVCEDCHVPIINQQTWLQWLVE